MTRTDEDHGSSDSPSSMRVWFLTWTTYGTWLPGDRRGFVSPVQQLSGEWTMHNRVGTPYDRDEPALRVRSTRQQRGATVRLTRPQAVEVIDQLRETAAHRGWYVVAVAVMANHLHLVLEVGDDPDPPDMLRDLKSYLSRRLNRLFGQLERWWTQGGSVRRKRDRAAILEAIRDTRDQSDPLAVFLDPTSELVASLPHWELDTGRSSPPRQ